MRIGVSAAKGLCFALSIPLIAIDTLLILAQAAQDTSDFIIPMIDARRMEVYTCVLDRERRLIDPTRAEVLSAASYAKFLNKGKVTFIGNGVEKWQKIGAHTKASFRSGILPSAQNMGILANELFLKNEFVDVAYFEPYYPKDFQTFKSQ